MYSHTPYLPPISYMQYKRTVHTEINTLDVIPMGFIFFLIKIVYFFFFLLTPKFHSISFPYSLSLNFVCDTTRNSVKMSTGNNVNNVAGKSISHKIDNFVGFLFKFNDSEI